MDPLTEHVLKQLGISEEQFEAEIEETKQEIENDPESVKYKVKLQKIDNETVGNAAVFTFQNDNQLGELVMSLFMQVNDLAVLVMQLQTELEELKNA